MPSYKATYFFEGHQNAAIGAGTSVGWTESWYKTANVSVEQAIDDPDHEKYIEARRACLGVNYTMNFLRVSDESHKRRFKIRALGDIVGLAKDEIVAGILSAAQVQCSVLVDFEKLPDVGILEEPVHHRRFLMRGLPATVINGNVIENRAPAWAKFVSFFNFVGGHPAGVAADKRLGKYSWGIRFYNPASLPIIITHARPSPTNNRVLLLQLGGNITANRGDHFTVSGIDSPGSYNKTWTYLGTETVEAVVWQAFGTSRKRLQGTYDAPGRGVLRPNVFLYGTIDQYAVIGLRSKRTGRAFHQLRGRR